MDDFRIKEEGLKYCVYCGSRIFSDAVYCIHCGQVLTSPPPSPPPNNTPYDDGNIGWGVLSFFFPLVGLILYLVWRDEKPRTARIAGKGALAWLILCVSLVVLTIIIVVIVIATDYDYSEGAALLSHISGLFV